MTIALSVIVILAAVYAGILMFLWRFQERIVFQPPTAETGPVEASRLSYTAADDVPLVAYVVDATAVGNGTARPIVLAFHGNAVLAREMIPWAREVSRRLGVTVVLPEYRGYDGVAGVPTYEAARRDAEAALAATVEKFRVPAEGVVYYGHSLGTAVATELASAHAPRALILESPFTSARDMAARMSVVGVTFFWRAISRVHYTTVERVASLDVPVSVAHGERDVIVPARMGKAVYEAARRKGELLMVHEAGHNDVAAVAGDDYYRWMAKATGLGAK
jgi:fermentation-respiration switch protein FrsA (DUF1100 family)